MFLFFGFGMTWEPSSVPQIQYWTVAASCIGAIGVGLFGFGVYIATERGQGWLLLKRVSPMPPSMYFFAKTSMAILFSLIVVGLIFGIALLFGRIDLQLPRMLVLISVLVLSTIPFCALGLAIGYLTGPNSSHAVVNLVYLPLLFLGGVVVPYQLLPDFLQLVAESLPSFHAIQLAFQVLEHTSMSDSLGHVSVLVLYTVASLAIAVWRYYRDEGVTYG